MNWTVETEFEAAWKKKREREKERMKLRIYKSSKIQKEPLLPPPPQKKPKINTQNQPQNKQTSKQTNPPPQIPNIELVSEGITDEENN